MAPRILHEERPARVEWSSIWVDQPELHIVFGIEPDDAGSFVTWTLLGNEGVFLQEDLRRRRHRLNQLINGQLRDAFDQ